jgi:hypothetical protein
MKMNGRYYMAVLCWLCDKVDFPLCIVVDNGGLNLKSLLNVITNPDT